MVRQNARRKPAPRPRTVARVLNQVRQVAQAAQGSVMSRRRRAVIGRGRRRRGAVGGNTVTSFQDRKPAISTVGRFLRGAGAAAGGYFGNASLGRQLGAGVSRIFGQGAYSVTQNSLMKGGPPSFADISSGMRVCHREYVTDVVSSTAFQNTSFDINPANSTLFPWLQKIAQNFEQYSIKGMVFYYNTTSGDALSSTNNALGVVGMTCVTDPTDSALATKRECEDYAGTVSMVPSCSFITPVECKPTSQTVNRLYIYQGSVVSNEDKKFYSHGTLNLFTQGMQQAGVTVGELWVSYDIEFYTPKILPNATANQAASRIYVTGVTTSNTQFLGPNAIPTSSFTGNLGIYYQIDGGLGNVYFPSGTSAGYYLINLTSSSATPFMFAYTGLALSSNITTTATFQGNSQTSTPTPNGATASAWHGINIILYKADNNSGFFRIAPSTGGVPADQSSDLIVVKLPTVAVTGVSGLYTKTDPVYVKQQQKIEFDDLIDKLRKEFPLLGKILNMDPARAPPPVPLPEEECICDLNCECSHCYESEESIESVDNH